MTSIETVHTLLSSRRVSAVSLTEAFLRRCEAENGRYGAFLTLTRDRALEKARAVDAKLKRGEALSPLAGVPMCLKDNICTQNIPTTCASKMLEGYRPPYDAFVASLLDAEDCVLLGKTNMDEFAMGSTCQNSAFGGAVNPLNEAFVPGGSSGGTAAAVAAGLAVFGLGSDTGGSIRQPAAFCGLVGVKPTYGAVSRRGLVAFASSLDQIGPITRTVGDAVAVLSALTKRDGGDSTSVGLENLAQAVQPEVRGLRIGVADEFFRGCTQEVASSVLAAKDTLQRLGAEIVPVSFPLLSTCLNAYFALACAEAYSNLGRYDGLRYGLSRSGADFDEAAAAARGAGFGPEVRRRVLLGAYVLEKDRREGVYARAVAFRNAVRAQFEEIFSRCDCLLTPTVPFSAYEIDEKRRAVDARRSDEYTVPANLAELPAVTVPCGVTENGLRAGLQLMAPKFREVVILSAALAFERETAGAFLLPETEAMP